MKDKTPIISYIAIVFSALSFVAIKVRFLEYRVQDVSFIVGVLAILVTALVGWQIFNSIELKREIEDEIKEVNIIKKDVLLTKTEILMHDHIMKGNLYMVVGYLHHSEGLHLEAYEDYVNALWNILQITEKDGKVRQTISTCLTNLGKCVECLKTTKEKDLRMADPLTFNGNVRNIIESHSSNFTKEYREIFFQLESERKKYYNKESQI